MNPTRPSAPTLRLGGPDDTEWLLARFDEAIVWMVARGQPGQWGTEPLSRSPRGRKRVAEMSAAGGLRIAVLDDVDVGALVVGDHPPYVGGVDRSELYVQLLLVARTHAHRGLGAWLVQRAVAEARTRGADLLRVDCWAGAPTLVAWYEDQGFVRADSFEVNDGWRGQILTMDLRGG